MKYLCQYEISISTLDNYINMRYLYQHEIYQLYKTHQLNQQGISKLTRDNYINKRQKLNYISNKST